VRDHFAKVAPRKELGITPLPYSPAGDKFNDKGFIKAPRYSLARARYGIAARVRADLSRVGGRAATTARFAKLFTGAIEFPEVRKGTRRIRYVPSSRASPIGGENTRRARRNDDNAPDRPGRGRIYRLRFSTLARTRRREYPVREGGGEPADA